MGQSENEHWFEYRRCLITASKAHEVITKITKVEKGGGGRITGLKVTVKHRTMFDQTRKFSDQTKNISDILSNGKTLKQN